MIRIFILRRECCIAGKYYMGFMRQDLIHIAPLGDGNHFNLPLSLNSL